MPNGDGSEDFRNALESFEHRILREIRLQITPIKDVLNDVKREVQITNGRVTILEGERIGRAAAEAERAKVTHEAAALVASKAKEVIEARERSRKWWLGVISSTAAGVGVIATLSSLLAQHLH